MNIMLYSFTGVMYPYGNDWDKFIQQSVQHWEDFYIQWIRNEKDIFIIYPDNFVGNLAKATLKDLANFLTFKWKDSRMNCLLKQIENLYRQRKNNPEQVQSDKKPKHFMASYTNSCVSNQIYKLDIYKKKHLIWINASIRSVKHELEKRGFDSSYISDYEMKNFRIYVCPKT